MFPNSFLGMNFLTGKAIFLKNYALALGNLIFLFLDSSEGKFFTVVSKTNYFSNKQGTPLTTSFIRNFKVYQNEKVV